MIRNALAEKLKRTFNVDFKGRHFEAWRIVQAVAWRLRCAIRRVFQRMRKALWTLKGYAGRVRDVERRLADRPADGMRAPIIVVGMRSFPGAPYDGHMLALPLEQVEILTGRRPALAVVDRGYRGHQVATTRVLISGPRRGLTPGLAAALRRRSAIEPEIGHMKADGRLARCAPRGVAGDALFAALCGCGPNIRKLLAWLRVFLPLIFAAIKDAQYPRATRHGAT